MGLSKEGYWSSREILGYMDMRQDVNYFLILSDRGRGKSFELKMKFLDWVEKGEKFMCLYRTGFDMAAAVEDWIDPFIDHLGMDPKRFSWEGDGNKGFLNLLLDGEQIGWFRSLTAVNAIKHEYFPDSLRNVWWDEFIPLVWKKLAGVQSEGDALRTIIKTINHNSLKTRAERGLKPMRCFLVANPFTWDNPVLAYFHVDPRVGFGVHRVGPGVIVEMLPPLEDKSHGFQTVDQFLGDDVHKNQGWMDMMGFVRDVPKGVHPLMSVRFERDYFTIYTDEIGTMYVRTRKEHTDVWKLGMSGKPVLVRFGTHSGLREDELCLEDGGWGKRLKRWIYAGGIYFESANTKFEFINHVLNLKA